MESENPYTGYRPIMHWL